MPENQRSAKRAVLRVQATLSAPDGSTGMARTLDVSTGGLCVVTERPLKPNAHLNVTFQVSVQGLRTTVEASAQVQWCMLSSNQFKSGLQFISIAPGGLESIEALVAMALSPH